MLNKILCKLFGHRPFEEAWLVITTGQLGEEWCSKEKKEYIGKRCPRCGAWEHPEMNIRFER